MAPPLSSWTTNAVNLPEHADNPVHTDEGARAAGFEGALVAGTTVHAYLTHPAAAAWGSAWLDHGWSELRLLAPVMDHDLVEVVPVDGERIEARVGGQLRATLAVAAATPADAAANRRGREALERHPELTIDLGTRLGHYGVRAGDDLAVYVDERRAHPSAWSCIGNAVTKTFHVNGPWVHVRSAITHLAPVAADAVVVVRSALVDRFDTRAGERVVVDLEITLDGVPVALVEHESIVRLR